MEFAPFANLVKSTNHFCPTLQEPLERIGRGMAQFRVKAQSVGWTGSRQPSRGTEEAVQRLGKPAERGGAQEPGGAGAGALGMWMERRRPGRGM